MKKFDKYIPTIKFNKYVYACIIILIILLLGGLQRQKDGGIKIGDTMLIMGNYNKNLELSTGDVAKYEAEVQKYDDLINGFMLGTGKDLGSRTSTEMEWFLAKAENLAYLGQNNKAIRILIGAFKYYPDSPRIMDLLAGIYANAGAFQRALNLYEKIITLAPESKMMYAKQIIVMYIGLGNPDQAGKLYIEYIKDGGQADVDLVNQIRTARGLAPMQE